MIEPDIYPINFSSNSGSAWTEQQKADYLKADLDHVFECKGVSIKYTKVNSIQGYKYKHLDEEAITYQDSPIEFFKMIIYSRLGLDFFRRSPDLPRNQVINSKGEIKEVEEGTLYIFE